MRSGALLLLALVMTACGGAATGPSPSASATATDAASAGAVSPGKWTVTDSSKATVRVREQLVGVNAPSDAVLVAKGATGIFELKADGTFSSDSNVSFDLTTLTSEEPSRDRFIKMDTLRTSQFPKAEFVPTGVTGPVPASGEFAFTLKGKLTIRGATKDVSFDVQAKRDATGLTATATANPSWKFGDFGMSAPSVPLKVVSVVDEIRLAVDLSATAAK